MTQGTRYLRLGRLRFLTTFDDLKEALGDGLDRVGVPGPEVGRGAVGRPGQASDVELQTYKSPNERAADGARSCTHRDVTYPQMLRRAPQSRLFLLVVGFPRDPLEVPRRIAHRGPAVHRRPEHHKSVVAAVCRDEPEIRQLLKIMRLDHLRLELPVRVPDQSGAPHRQELECLSGIGFERGHGGLEDQPEPSVRVGERFVLRRPGEFSRCRGGEDPPRSRRAATQFQAVESEQAAYLLPARHTNARRPAGMLEGGVPERERGVRRRLPRRHERLDKLPLPSAQFRRLHASDPTVGQRRLTGGR